MDSSSGSNHGSDSPMMTPYLHFTRGDNLWLREIAPMSKGTVAAACIFIFILATVERLYASWSARTQARWAARTQAVVNPRGHQRAGSDSKESESDIAPVHVYPRTIPPFVLRYEIPRGLIFIGQSILRYMLMLVVMTYSASYIISALLGLGVGEMVFGRFAYETPEIVD